MKIVQANLTVVYAASADAPDWGTPATRYVVLTAAEANHAF